MIKRTFGIAFAVVAVITVPAVVYGAQAPVASDHATKKICRVQDETGSRLAKTRRCFTRAEEEQRRADSRRTVERVQALKPTFSK